MDKSGKKVAPVFSPIPYHNNHGSGLHWTLAALFIVADMAGAGIVALPSAVVRSRKLIINCIINN
jgi:hypothetical protein